MFVHVPLFPFLLSSVTRSDSLLPCLSSTVSHSQFARAIMPRYMSAIYATKRIGEFGAQQLLLDAAAIRGLLLGVPALVDEDDDLPPIESPL